MEDQEALKIHRKTPKHDIQHSNSMLAMEIQLRAHVGTWKLDMIQSEQASFLYPLEKILRVGCNHDDYKAEGGLHYPLG